MCDPCIPVTSFSLNVWLSGDFFNISIYLNHVSGEHSGAGSKTSEVFSNLNGSVKGQEWYTVEQLSMKTPCPQEQVFYNTQIYTTAVVLPGYVRRVNNGISGGHSCISIAAQWENHQATHRGVNPVDTSTGQLFSHFGFPTAGMSSGSGSP